MTTIRFNPKAQMDWPSVVATARGFSSWLLKQLAALAPSWLAQRLSAFTNRPRIVLGDAQWRVVSPAGLGDLVLDPASPDAELHERIARFDATCFAQRIDVVIPAESGFARTLRLPEAAASRLRSVVELQIERLSPFRAEHVSFGFRRLGDPANGEMEAEVWLIPKQTLRVHEQRLERVGLFVRSFVLDAHELRFEPLASRRTANERLQYVLAAIAAAAVVMAMVLAPVMRASELASISTGIAALRKPAHEAGVLRAEFERLAAPVRASSAELAKPGALEVLRVLTELLPNDAQLSDLDVDVETRRVRISGISRSARDLIARLSKSGRFSHVALAAPSGKTADGRDLFQIVMATEAGRGR